MDAFTAMALDRRMEEANEPSMMDAFTAMALERRTEEANAPTFLDFMHSLAMEQTKQKNSKSLEQHLASTFKQEKNEKMNMLSKGLPHMMALSAVREYEAA